MKNRNIYFSIIILIFISVLVLTGCGKKGSEVIPNNMLSKQEAEEGWQLLFNGKTLAGWVLDKPGSWEVVDGTIARVEKGGFISTEKEYGDFIFYCEFKISPGCNSGVKVRKTSEQPGLEMQIIDSYGRAEMNTHSCGALYDIMAPSSNEAKPAGEWNYLVIACDDNNVIFELNGVKVIEVDLDLYTTANLNIDGTKNKFNKALRDWSRTGQIGLQDHGSSVWFRNIKIKEL